MFFCKRVLTLAQKIWDQLESKVNTVWIDPNQSVYNIQVDAFSVKWQVSVGILDS